LTKPVNIYYERYCVTYYLQILEFLRANLEKHVTLEDDVETLKQKPGSPKISWGMQMAILYRLEKKKIVRN